MGKCCLHASSFVFYRIIIKVAGIQDRHKSSVEFDFGPNQTTHFGVTCPWVTKISHFWTWISLKPVGQSWSNFMCSTIGVGERLQMVLGQIVYRIIIKLAGNQDDHKSSNKFEFWKHLFTAFRVICPWALEKNIVDTNAPSVSSGPSSNLQTTRTGIKACISSISSQSGLFTSELHAFERYFFPIDLYWRKRGHVIILFFIRSSSNTGDQDGRKLSEFEFWPRMSSIYLELLALEHICFEHPAIYCWKKPFWACWLTGERALLFGLLVSKRFLIITRWFPVYSRKYLVISKSFLVLSRWLLVYSRKHLVISKRFLVITRWFLLYSRKYLIISKRFLVCSRKYHVISKRFLVITRCFLVYSRKNLVISKRFLVITRWFFGYSRKYLVISKKFLVCSRKYLVISKRFLVITRWFLVYSRKYLVISKRFIVITRWFLVYSRKYLVISKKFHVITRWSLVYSRKYLIISKRFLVITR